MFIKNTLTRKQIAAKVAADIPSGSVVNLGIGMPTLVANELEPNKIVFLHSENGILGMGPSPEENQQDPDLINAGKQYVTILPGGCFFHHADSFAMMRGGHLDYCVLGAFQVSSKGDLANWHTGQKNAIPAVGGAMDLAIGAKKVFVMTNLFTRDGKCKLVEKCTYPVTGLKCVDRVYTDVATFEITEQGFEVLEIHADISFDQLKNLCQLNLTTA